MSDQTTSSGSGHSLVDRAKSILRRHRWFALSLAVLFLARLPVGWYVTSHHREFFLHNDGDDYRNAAISFAQGRGFMIDHPRWFEPPRDKPMPEAFRPLGLSFLAGIFLLGDPQSMFRLFVFQSIVYLAFLLLLKTIIARWYGELASWIGIGIVLIHPLIDVWSFRFSTELLFATLLVGFVLQWWRLNGVKSYLWLGILVALATYVRPTAAMLMPFAGLAVLWRLPWRQWWKGVAFGAVFLLALTPAMVRNYTLFGVAKPTTFYASYPFWLGNSRETLEGYRSGNGRGFIAAQDRLWERGLELARNMPAGCSANPARIDQFWADQAKDELRQMGMEGWLYLVVMRAWHFLRPWPMYGAHSATVFWAVLAFEVSLYGLGLIGAWLQYRRDPAMLWPLAVLAIAGLVAHALVLVVMRYRIPFIDLPFAILASGVLGGWLTRWWQSRRRPEGEAGAASEALADGP